MELWMGAHLHCLGWRGREPVLYSRALFCFLCFVLSFFVFCAGPLCLLAGVCSRGCCGLLPDGRPLWHCRGVVDSGGRGSAGTSTSCGDPAALIK